MKFLDILTFAISYAAVHVGGITETSTASFLRSTRSGGRTSTTILASTDESPHIVVEARGGDNDNWKRKEQKIASPIMNEDTAIIASYFERSVKMQGPGCQNVKWTIDREALKITFHVESAKGADWVGFGISENGGMKGADIAIVRKTPPDSTGSTKNIFAIDDRVSVDFVMPTKDTLQNIELLHSEVLSQRIVAVLRRDLDTCDIEDLSVEAHKQHLICASGPINPEGEILYHGPNHASALVNLVVDEELLLETPLTIRNRDSFTSPSPGVTIYGDPEKAVVPFPVDIQMPNITLPADVQTSYLCIPVELPFDFKFIRAESVWGEGLSLDDDSPPSHMHHQGLYGCPDFDVNVIKPFSCNNMPLCDELEFIIARGTVAVLPPGLNLKAKAGRKILLVHYENSLGVPINDFGSGFRFWAEPPLLPSQRTSGDLFMIVGHLPSIRIPADPQEKDYSIQYMIPGGATRQYIPLKVPFYKQWKILPGDSLLLTCTYKAHPELDILGGLGADDEMCSVGLIFAKEVSSGIPNKKLFAVGYAVEEGQSLKNAYVGPFRNGREQYFLDPSFATFTPSNEEINFKSIKNHRKNICELFVRDSIAAPSYTFAEYNITAMLSMIVAFAFCCIIGAKPICDRMLPEDCDERRKRNTVVYLGQLIYGTIGLPIVCHALLDISKAEQTFDGIDPDRYLLARGIVVVQAILYLIKLFYRISIRIEVVLHHIITVIMIVYFLLVAIQSFALHYIQKLAFLY